MSRKSAGSRDKKTVLFLVDDVTRFGGVRTRVTEELSCLSASDDISPIVVSRCNSRNLMGIPSAIGSLEVDVGFPINGFAYPKIPHGGLAFLYEISFLLNFVLSFLMLIPVVCFGRVSAIYGHNNEAGLTAVALSRAFGIPCIVDLHGVEVDEYLEKHPNWNAKSRRIRFWRRIEWKILVSADCVITVSRPHSAETLARGGSPSRTTVVPCFADERKFDFDPEARARIRGVLGFAQDEIVYVYSGILPAKYDEGSPLHLFSRLDPSGQNRLLILAPDDDNLATARNQLSPSIAARSVLLQVPRSEVPKYLSAADIAILVRKPTVVNRVASPTKFAEYLLCGLPVIISEGIGDSSDLVRSDDVGVVLPLQAVDDSRVAAVAAKVRELAGPQARSRVRAVGEDALSRKRWRPHFLRILRFALNGEKCKLDTLEQDNNGGS
jgi:glycosyltransferase involved in cell wall biosynthesis